MKEGLIVRIFWVTRLRADIDKFHITTWREMSRELKSFGHDVRLAVSGHYSRDVFDDSYVSIPVIRIKYLFNISFWITGFFVFLVECTRFKPDVIILDFYTTFFSIPLLLIPKKKRPIMITDMRSPLYDPSHRGPCIVEFFNKTYSNKVHLYGRYFLNGITVINDYYKQELCASFGIDDKVVGVWTSGADIVRFSPDKYRTGERPDYLNGKFVLLQHGEISHNRGIIECVKALRALNKKDVCLILLGAPVKNKWILDEVSSLSMDLGLGSNVYHLPPVPYGEIPKYISYCDCAIMAYPKIAYWDYNNPIKLLEYLAMAKVVIATDTTAFRDVMGDGRCACYINDNDPESIARAIKYCYDHRHSLPGWGMDGPTIIKERYTWEKQAVNLLSFIGTLNLAAGRQ